jgi:cell division protein FtsB
MKKKRRVIIITAIGFISIVFLQVFSSGHKHVVVVEENVSLTNENKALTKENKGLKQSVSELEEENKELTDESNGDRKSVV